MTKIIGFRLIGIVLIACALLVNSASAQFYYDMDLSKINTDHLRTWIELPKTEFKDCEQIWLYLFIVNEGSDSVILPRIDEQTTTLFDVNLLDSSRSRLPYTGLRSDMVPPYPKSLLLPRDTVVFYLNVIEGYGVGGWLTRLPRYVPTGRYEVSGTLLGRINTNQLSFSIVPLTVAEEKVVAEYYTIFKGRQNDRDAARDCAAILDANPDNPLACRICDFILMMLGRGREKQESVEKYMMYYLDRCPDCGPTGYLFSYFMHKKSDKELLRLFGEGKSFKESKYAAFSFWRAAKESGKTKLFQEAGR